jgi:hypothetical protein
MEQRAPVTKQRAVQILMPMVSRMKTMTTKTARVVYCRFRKARAPLRM